MPGALACVPVSLHIPPSVRALVQAEVRHQLADMTQKEASERNISVISQDKARTLVSQEPWGGGGDCEPP